MVQPKELVSRFKNVSRSILINYIEPFLIEGPRIKAKKIINLLSTSDPVLPNSRVSAVYNHHDIVVILAHDYIQSVFQK